MRKLGSRESAVGYANVIRSAMHTNEERKMFNVRVKTFFDTEQIQIFSKPQKSKGDSEKCYLDKTTGEISKTKPLSKVKFDDGTVVRGREVEEFSKKEDCLYRSCTRTKKSVYDIARSDEWKWFVTLTFNGEKLNRYDYAECTKKMSYWLNNMRKKFPDMKYIIVPEQHADGAYHFHGLFKNVGGFVPSGRFDNDGRIIYNWESYKWGWTTATIIGDTHRTVSYLCKYITKELCMATESKKRYWASRNVNRPIIKDLYVDPQYLNLVLVDSIGSDAYLKTMESMYGKINYIDQSIRKTCDVFTENENGF